MSLPPRGTASRAGLSHIQPRKLSEPVLSSPTSADFFISVKPPSKRVRNGPSRTGITSLALADNKLGVCSCVEMNSAPQDRKNGVLARGLEPPRVAPYGPEPYASADSATRAKRQRPQQCACASELQGRTRNVDLATGMKRSTLD